MRYVTQPQIDLATGRYKRHVHTYAAMGFMCVRRAKAIARYLQRQRDRQVRPEVVAFICRMRGQS